MRKKSQWTGYFRFPLNTNERLFLVTWYCQSESLKLGDRGYIYIYIPALTPHVGWVWSWFSLLLREVSPGIPVFPSPQKPTFPNSHSIWNARTRLNEFIWTPKCFVGKQAIYIFFFFTPLLYGHPLVSVLERTDCTRRLTFQVSCLIDYLES